MMACARFGASVARLQQGRCRPAMVAPARKFRSCRSRTRVGKRQPDEIVKVLPIGVFSRFLIDTNNFAMQSIGPCQRSISSIDASWRKCDAHVVESSRPHPEGRGHTNPGLAARVGREA